MLAVPVALPEIPIAAADGSAGGGEYRVLPEAPRAWLLMN